MKITKAIIPVAGWGTRRLPITKTIEKCMLPIGNRPIVDYTVQDCIKAGITDIYFVVGESSDQIRDYYRTNIDLNDYLKRTGRAEMIEAIRPPKVNLHYIVQSAYGKYGTAIPVSMVFDHIAPGEPVVVLMGDDAIYNTDASSEVARMINATPEGGSALLGVEVSRHEVSRYGVIRMDADHAFQEIVEKPQLDDAPSNIINVSKYVLSYDILKRIHDYARRDDVPGEYLITVPINEAVTSGAVIKVVSARGTYLDSGTIEGWLEANRYVVEQEP
jgi:UTP--glucose-1-phosphate uridylyltransferase